jgi:DNA-binding CsgD family transcriptional regulator
VRPLTAAQNEVARLVGEGLTGRQIAERRRTAIRATANQLAVVFSILGVSTRAEFVSRLIRRAEVQR